jgi:TPP-dependent pyruvate/acetoin dehydrogenase alpha subunit
MAGKNNSHSASHTTSTPAENHSSNNAGILNAARLQQLYSIMLECRRMEGRQRHKSPLALLVGCAMNLQPEDFLAPGPYPLLGEFLRKASLPKSKQAARPARRRTGTSEPEDLSALHLIHAPDSDIELSLGLGVAVASKMQKNKAVTLAFSPASTVSNESLQLAAAQKLPIVYVVENSAALNGRGTKTVSQGVPSISVDGNDVVAVYRVSQESIRHARDGYGPAVIEARTLDAGRHDPLGFMENYLKQKNLWPDAWKKHASRT